MSRLKPLLETERTGKAGELLGMVGKKLGRVPNMMATLARSPAALEGYLNFSGALGHGELNAQERERIALLVGTRNKCDYCVTAHSKIGAGAGLTPEEVTSAKDGRSMDSRGQAILNFAAATLSKNGHLTDTDYSAAKAAGLSEAAMLEVIGVVCLNIYTNYVNHFMDPVIDF
jgi:uncharacterized peroxidase-related enzyme